MLLSKRSSERREPERDAKCIFIFCEGVREYNYFYFFDKLSEKIKVEVYLIDSESENNTPIGLYNIACNCLKPSENNPYPKFDLGDDVDEIWIVFDKDVDKTSSREPQIVCVKENCIKENSLFDGRNVWNVAESNPCFEVWLYYHFEVSKPKFDDINISAKWKSHLDTISKGGFDSRKHPQLIGNAIRNAEANHEEAANRPDIACTQVYQLGKSIFPIIKDRLRQR